MSLNEEVDLLRQIPLFSKIDPSKLKLLAFTSERLSFGSGQDLFQQGDVGDTAYIIIDGEEQTFNLLTATAGLSAEFGNRPSVSIIGLRGDGSILAVLLLFEESSFTPGSPEFHGFSTFGAVAEIVPGNPLPVILGTLAEGSIYLEFASMEEGAPVKGEVTGPWFSL